MDKSIIEAVDVCSLDGEQVDIYDKVVEDKEASPRAAPLTW